MINAKLFLFTHEYDPYAGATYYFHLELWSHPFRRIANHPGLANEFKYNRK